MARSTLVARANSFLILILLGVIILRIPNLFEPYWYGDEGIYLAIGEGLRQGGLLYRDIFDHKPPAIYILAYLAGSLVWFKFFLLAFHLATVLLFWKLAGKIFQESSIPQDSQLKALKFSTLLFALFTTLPIFEGHIANAELFMALPTIAGILIVWPFATLAPKRIFWGGVVFCLAFLFKVPAFFDAAAVPLYWLYQSAWRLEDLKVTARKTVILGIGFALPLAATALFFILQGAFPFFLEGALSQNVSYVSSWEGPVVGDLSSRAMVLTGFLAFLFLVKKFLDRTTLFVCLWLGLSIFAMLLSGRPYPHYVIQAIAPAVLALSLLFYGAQKYRFWVVPAILLLLFSLTFYQFGYYRILPYYSNFIKHATGRISTDQYFANFDKRTLQTYKIAKYLSERTYSSDRIFIWGTEPELYALARRVPPGRYVTSFHIVDFLGQEETMESLRKNPPRYIIRMQTEKRELPGFAEFLQNNYIYVEMIDSAEIWRRIDPALAKILLNQ